MTNLELAIAAWEAVRKRDDARWEKLPIGLKAKLTHLAGKYRDGAKVHEGDYPPEGFAEKIVEFASRQEFTVFGDGDGSVPEYVSLDETKKAILATDAEVALAIDATPDHPFAEHEDTHIPSPNSEDVDPPKIDLAKDTEAETALKGRLPADFPSHDLLHDAGINTYTQLIKQRDSAEGLEGITGIGPVTAAKIEEWLSE